jgi:hypothetical protein
MLISHIRIEDTSTNHIDESQQSGFQKNLGFDDSSIFKEDQLHFNIHSIILKDKNSPNEDLNCTFNMSNVSKEEHNGSKRVSKLEISFKGST